MRIREYRESDDVRLKEIYDAQCIPYDWPNIADAQFIVKLVVVDEADIVIAAALARKTVEIYGLFDPSWETPAWRFEALRMLHERMRHEIGSLGYKDAHAWIPPRLAKSFARKLKHLFGWQADPWPSYCRRTGY